MKRKTPHPEKHIDSLETRRNPLAYIFYGALAMCTLAIIIITVIATVKHGK